MQHLLVQDFRQREACFRGFFKIHSLIRIFLGVSSGAALGATIAILFGVQVSVLGIGTIGVCAFIGAILTIMLVYLIGGMKKGAKTIGILLTGTAISTLFFSCDVTSYVS